MSAPSSACPSADDLAAFAEHGASIAGGEAIAAHLDGCLHCREVVLALAQHGTTQSAPDGDGGGDGGIAHERGGKIGRYVVLERLGRGGMGVVYRAYDPELDRRVALKLVRADRRNQEGLRQRLVREARAMARVVHRNVLTVFDAGTVDDEVYIAMALVEGGTLRDWLRAGERPRRAILERFIAAGRGLAAAHAADIVHRDFKPDNVLVDGEGHVYVTDFGLARASAGDTQPAPPSSPLSATVTEAGAVVGTPAFMPPEQLRGESVDARADQFAFCVALYEALTGRLPFAGKTAAERLAAIEEGPTPARALPAWLWRVVERGLRVDPAARWPSMAELLARLEADPARAARRRGLGLLALGGVAAAATVTLMAHERRIAGCRASARAVDAVWNAGRRNAMYAAFLAVDKQFASEAFVQAKDLVDEYARMWADTKEHTCIDRSPSPAAWQLRQDCLDERLAALGRLTELFGTADGKTALRAPDAVRALPSLQACRDPKTLAAEERLPDDAALRARVLAVRRKLSEVQALRSVGRYRDGDAEARALAPEMEALRHRPTEAEYWHVMTLLGGDFRDGARITSSARKALVAAESVPLPRVAFQIWHLLFRHAAHSGYGAAADEAEAHMAAWTEAGAGQDAPVYLLWDRGRRLSDTGKPEEGISLLRQTLALAERYHFRPGIVGELMTDIGNACLNAHQFDCAKEMYERDIRETQAAGGPHDPDAAPDIGNLGVLYLYLHQPDKARAQFQQALDLYRDAYGDSDPRVAEQLHSLAVVEGDAKHYVESERLAQQALEIWENKFGPDHPRVAYALTTIGSALYEMGKPRVALKPLERALAIRARVEELPEAVGETKMYLGFALVDGGGERRRGLALVAEARKLLTDARADDLLARLDEWEKARVRR